MIYHGSIKDAYLLTITDLEAARFVYGTVVYDTSGRFYPDDWIATSNLVELREVENGFAAITQNALYFIGSYTELDIPWQVNCQSGHAISIWRWPTCLQIALHRHLFKRKIIA